MERTTPPLPSRADLLALMRATQANAKDLLGEAELLAGARRFPRALALAALSSEEVSKARLCLLAIILPELTPDYFWDHFRNHAGKLARVQVFADLLQPEPVGPVDEHVKKVVGRSKSTQDLKERCLYVDYRRGKILLPSQVTERAARKEIKASGRRWHLRKPRSPLTPWTR